MEIMIFRGLELSQKLTESIAIEGIELLRRETNLRSRFFVILVTLFPSFEDGSATDK